LSSSRKSELKAENEKVFGGDSDRQLLLCNVWLCVGFWCCSSKRHWKMSYNHAMMITIWCDG